MSYVSSFGKRRVYLVNHDPVEPNQLDALGWALSKFIALQTINEFRDGVYNDSIAGELFASEQAALRHLSDDEYYLELIVSSDAVSHSIKSGQVFIHKGFAPKILSLKTVGGKVYDYDEELGFKGRAQEKVNTQERAVYNRNPDRWPLFAAFSHHLPFSKALPLIHTNHS